MQAVKSLVRVAAIPLFSDNYSYAVQFIGEKKSSCFLIDPAETASIFAFLDAFPGLKVSHVLYTHKHLDHIGNPTELLQQLTLKERLSENVKIVSSAADGVKIPTLNHPLFVDANTNNPVIPQDIEVPSPFSLEALFAPCHTLGHVLYHFRSAPKTTIPEPHLQEEIQKGYRFYDVEECLFTGDTMFIGGCGRFFEGNATQILSNFDAISNIQNKNTKVFCAHEYTKDNLTWAAQVEKDNEPLQKKLQQVILKSQSSLPTIPSTITEELETNVFARTRSASLQNLFKTTDPVEIMHMLRSMKSANVNTISLL